MFARLLWLTKVFERLVYCAPQTRRCTETQNHNLQENEGSGFGFNAHFFFFFFFYQKGMTANSEKDVEAITSNFFYMLIWVTLSLETFLLDKVTKKIAEIPGLKSYSSILPCSDLKCFQLV